MFARVSCARCGVLFTPPVAYKRITDVLQNSGEDHHVDDPLQFVDEDADEHREFHRDGFLHTGRWRICWLGRIEELASRSSFCLKSRIFVTASELIRSCFHRVGWSLSVQGEIPKWRCWNGLRVQYCEDVCRLLRPIRWLAASLCTFRSVGTAGGLSFECSLYLFLNSLSLVCTCVVPRFLSGEHRGVFHF